jgi:D-mannonate dehydratase
METKLLNKNQLQIAANLLKQGEIVGFPTETVYGLGVVYNNEAAFEKLMVAKNRPSNKPFTLMCSSLEMIEKFVDRGKVNMIHFRDVIGTVDNFTECFLGDGRMNPARVMKALVDHGYDGLMLDDHVPFLTGDTRWGHTARANAFGYLRGMLEAIKTFEN